MVEATRSDRPWTRPAGAVPTTMSVMVVGLFAAVSAAHAETLLVGQPEQPMSAQRTLDGWASVDEWGQNGTTGGAAGETVDADTAAEFLSVIASPDPLVIRGNSGLMHDVTSNKTILGVGAGFGITGGGLNIGLPSYVTVSWN
jgi:pectate lyase